MNILVTNDDGINSEGLWILVKELKRAGRITVVVPDSERSAIGTAVSLFRPVKVEKAASQVEDVDTYITDGTPSDCVILAMGKLISENVDLVVSGINDGSNVGEDVYISGTVGGALQGYFRGSSALSVSAPRQSRQGKETAAVITARLAERLGNSAYNSRIFLNVNAPDLSLSQVAGVKITRLAQTSHINTVEEGDYTEHEHYNLIRQQIAGSGKKGTDIHAKENGFISVTPLFASLFNRPPHGFLQELCDNLA
jgi:5'-nucleotidase